MVSSFDSSCKRQLTIPVNKSLPFGGVIVKMKKGTVLSNFSGGKNRIIDAVKGKYDAYVKVEFDEFRGSTEVDDKTVAAIGRRVESLFKQYRDRRE